MQSALDGFNVSSFAYGQVRCKRQATPFAGLSHVELWLMQTGSGKTFTMVGNKQTPGVMPRAVRRLFSLIEKNAHVLEVRPSPPLC